MNMIKFKVSTSLLSSWPYPIDLRSAKVDNIKSLLIRNEYCVPQVYPMHNSSALEFFFFFPFMDN